MEQQQAPWTSISELPPDRPGKTGRGVRSYTNHPLPELYQRESLYNHYLPYSSQLDRESSEWLEEIKLNLSRAVLLRDLRPGVVTWLSRLTGYISLYGYKFTKQDHLQFIALAWELLTIPELEHGLLHFFIRILIKLLRKPRLITPADLGERQRVWSDYNILKHTTSVHCEPTQFGKE